MNDAEKLLCTLAMLVYRDMEGTWRASAVPNTNVSEILGPELVTKLEKFHWSCQRNSPMQLNKPPK